MDKRSMSATMTSGPRQAIFYVTDLNFALPTLASALEVRRKVPRPRADVHIVATDFTADVFRRVKDFAEPQGIGISSLESAKYSGFDSKNYNKTHVPISALGRFFMLDAVPENYDRILYLDGDVWPVGNPLELLEAKLLQGHIGAAEDRYFFRRREIGPVGRATRAYFTGLGIDGNAGYFNSGVLLADTETWRSICADAFEFFLKNTARCLYHDQSALNAVAAGRWSRLTPQWNFVNSYLEWGLQHPNAPRMLHFAGGEKPWTVPFHPYHEIYMRAFAPLRGLGLPIKLYSGEQLQALKKRARLRKIRDKLFVHRALFYRHTFERLVETAAIH